MPPPSARRYSASSTATPRIPTTHSARARGWLRAYSSRTSGANRYRPTIMYRYHRW
ncbi:Uncharacterised protein [Bordetella pertussis]|nr:Uncharacterised protein [Bordetella pertussis]